MDLKLTMLSHMPYLLQKKYSSEGKHDKFPWVPQRIEEGLPFHLISD